MLPRLACLSFALTYGGCNAAIAAKLAFPHILTLELAGVVSADSWTYSPCCLVLEGLCA